MKKSIALVLALVMVFVMAACAPQPAPAPAVDPAPAAPADPAPAAPAEPPAEPEVERLTINVIYHPTIGGTTAIAIAEAHGFFEEENLDIKYQRFTAGPPEIAAMVAGRADIGFIGSGAAWLAFRGDVNIIALDNLALTDEIVARKSSGIATMEDLRGKTVACQLGTAGENILNMALEQAGIARDELTIINMDNNNLTSAISGAGKVDAIAGWQPGTTAAMEALGEDGIIVATNRDFPEHAFPSTWVANKEFVANNPEAVQRFMNALTKAQAYRAENMQEACEWASEKAGQAANDMYTQIESAIWPTGAEMKEYYASGAFLEMLENLCADQVRAEKITEADVKNMSEVFVSTFALEASKNY